MKRVVDVHILTLPEIRVDWLENCLKSLENEPVNIYLCEGITGDTARARTEAFKKGYEEYVSFVDPDDEILPGIFAKLVSELEKDKTNVMAYSDEILINENGKKICDGWSVSPKPFHKFNVDIHCINGEYIHHLRVIRRDAMNKCLPLKTKIIPEPCLMHDLSKLGGFSHVKETGYKWRIHNNNTFNKYMEEDYEEVLSWR